MRVCVHTRFARVYTRVCRKMTSVKTASESWEKTSGASDDSEDKIQYAFRIILDAHRGKAMTNDAEIRSLRQTVEELKGANANLAKKFAQAEREIMEQQHRNQVLSKDNENLSLANRQLLQRVEKYKRIQQTFSEALEHSGQEEELPPMNFSTDYRSQFTLPAVAPLPAVIPSLSPKTGERTSGERPAAAAAPAALDSNGKDGKHFFRVVRTRLPFESFNAFLSIIKKLNSHEYTRETAVEEAKKIFGTENADLIGDFQALISRHNFQQ